MTAYVIDEATITDLAQYELYKAAAAPSVAAAGGRYIARGGDVVPLEGGWTPRRMVIIEFPDLATARRFYDSPAYREAREARAGAANFRMIAIDGV